MAKEKTLGIVIKRVKGGLDFRALVENEAIPSGYKFFGYMQGQGKRGAGEFLANILEARAPEIMNYG